MLKEIWALSCNILPIFEWQLEKQNWLSLEKNCRRIFWTRVHNRPPPPKENLPTKPILNNLIKAEKVRVIDSDGKNLGVLPFREAFKMAQERNLDLVQVTQKVEPPVCKIVDYGKYLYLLEKQERKARLGQKEALKILRLSFNISEHDLETKAKIAEKFLAKGYFLKIEMLLRGREKMLSDFAKNKIQQFLQILKNRRGSFVIKKDLQKRPGGFTIVISKA